MWERSQGHIPGEDFRRGLGALGTRSRFEFPEADWPETSRPAAVLIPFWEVGGAGSGNVHTLLTRRAATLSRHAGQVSFAGGLLEPGESWEIAALREANEEVGLDGSLVEIIGCLDDAWSGTGNHLVAIVAWLRDEPQLTANREVADLLSVLVRDVLKPQAWRKEPVISRGIHFDNDVVEWAGASAFGLSADLLQEALRWGIGESPARGPQRLSELRAFLGAQAAE
jgi:8-oxo-dGTP pyrophosphatase MutT (NUDIX family)